MPGSDDLLRLSTALSQRYVIERELGSGGMATVYLAHDVRHDRPVALKVLRPELAAIVGAQRFLHEIRTTAQLQHPHILALHDSGEIDGTVFYVMPFVKGVSLRDRLEREGQLPVVDAVRIASEVADALGYAHEHGVIHRDIKPENILLQDGHAVVADFGIALAASGGPAAVRLTETGLSLGTPAYMAPEQAMGDRALTPRVDIYALGCVVYEMLAGEPPFSGPTAQAIVARVMTEEPRRLHAQRRTVPAELDDCVRKALEKLPADRFATASEFRAALTVPAPGVVGGRASGRPMLLGLAAALIVGIGLGALAASLRRPPVDTTPHRWNIVLPPNESVALVGPSTPGGWYSAMAASPDGKQLAYVAPQGSTTVLVLRSAETGDEAAVPGSDGASDPFYSPDGAWIGFVSGNLLRKVSSTGGTPITLAQVASVTGAVWVTPDEIVVFERNGFELHRVAAAGGGADSVTRLTTQFGTPGALPGGRWLVGQLSSGQLALLSLENGSELAITQRGVLALDSVRQSDLLFGASPQWIRGGYLVYATGDGQLSAMPFDAARRAVLGEAVPVVTGVRMEAGFGAAEYAISGDGTLTYVPGANQLYVNVALVSPDGHLDTLPFPRGPYTQPRVSPDGTRLAVQVRNPLGGWQVMLMDMATGVRQQVPVDGNYRAFPASWLPSGHALMIGLFDPVQFLNYGARIQALDTGAWTNLHLSNASYMTVAPDGKSFVFSDWRRHDLYLRSLGPDTTSTRVPGGVGTAASFSPDGRWLSWGGDDGSVDVTPLPPTGTVYHIAQQGDMPLWMPNGRAIVYRDRSRYYRVPVTTTGGFHTGKPTLLIEGSFLSAFAWNHAMSPDGRVLVLMNSPDRDARTLETITNFQSLVARTTHAGRR
ncbi:MAG TPA: protein kinase [Gemmatimonadaceae bacterium]|nr:protein kinase [Gemmatimonadaceae bacterium]